MIAGGNEGVGVGSGWRGRELTMMKKMMGWAPCFIFFSFFLNCFIFNLWGNFVISYKLN
ncbi:hypothetical protein HanRHA438_Chr10g0433121 [Helianthus annuus]|nr:hypothetical protein HanRHA438_Chr10g0433121 [Helianthus annuus]